MEEEKELKETICITWGPVGSLWELISSLENMIIQENDGIAISFSFFLLVAQTLKIKREQEKAWEQKWPEGEMRETSLEMQGMVVQECCFAASLCETPFCPVQRGEQDHSPVKSGSLMLLWIKWNSAGYSTFLADGGF